MAYEHEPGNFSLFRERHPEKYKQNPPSHTGSGKISLPDGSDLDVTLACWVKDGTNGKYFSGKIENKDKEHYVPGDERPQREEDEDEDIPF